MCVTRWTQWPSAVGATSSVTKRWPPRSRSSRTAARVSTVWPSFTVPSEGDLRRDVDPWSRARRCGAARRWRSAAASRGGRRPRPRRATASRAPHPGTPAPARRRTRRSSEPSTVPGRKRRRRGGRTDGWQGCRRRVGTIDRRVRRASARPVARVVPSPPVTVSSSSSAAPGGGHGVTSTCSPSYTGATNRAEIAPVLEPAATPRARRHVGHVGEHVDAGHEAAAEAVRPGHVVVVDLVGRCRRRVERRSTSIRGSAARPHGTMPAMSARRREPTRARCRPPRAWPSESCPARGSAVCGRARDDVVRGRRAHRRLALRRAESPTPTSPTTRPSIDAQYRQVGVGDVRLEISGARSVVEHLDGQRGGERGRPQGPPQRVRGVLGRRPRHERRGERRRRLGVRATASASTG